MAATQSAIDFARYLVFLAGNEDEGDCLTPMRVQKLLYYVQGWSLAQRDRAAFSERIEAWAHGPVVKEVYKALGEFGRNAVPCEWGSGSVLGLEDRCHAEAVWQVYKPYSAISLSDMTHQEKPWMDARGNLPREAKSNKEITHSSMRDYFKGLAENAGFAKG